MVGFLLVVVVGLVVTLVVDFVETLVVGSVVTLVVGSVVTVVVGSVVTVVGTVVGASVVRLQVSMTGSQGPLIASQTTSLVL